MKQILLRLLPRSLREYLKLKYYNHRIKNYEFGLINTHYTTKKGASWTVTTNKPLYFIVSDIDRYERFYKIKDQDNVIDAGANEGSLSVVYSQQVGGQGNVFAFEPDTKNLVTLEHNLSLNPEASNVTVVSKGLWDKDDTLEFYESGTVGSSIFYEDSNAKKIEIEVTSIDAFVELHGLKHLDFVKMDIEGAEIQAVVGAEKTIGSFRPDFAIASYHIVDGQPTYLALEAYFEKIDYPFKTEFFDDGEIITYAGDSINKLS